jgi:hypothetical protein
MTSPKSLIRLAEPTGLEPATSDVTGRRSNQLNYDSALKLKLARFSVAVGDGQYWTRTSDPRFVRPMLYQLS